MTFPPLKITFKQAISVVLSIFVALTFGVAVAKSFRPVGEPTRLSDGKTLVFFHATGRCPTCRTMERLTRRVLTRNFQRELERGSFRFVVLEYDRPENREIADEFNVATATLLLLERRDGRTVFVRDLLKPCWDLANDESAFQKMLTNELFLFLANGAGLSSENLPNAADSEFSNRTGN